MRVVALMLVFCFLLPLCVLAEDGNGLDAAAAAARAKIEIPEHYTDFYSQVEQDNDSRVYFLSWSGEGSGNEKGGNASVKVDERGRIIYYSHYEYGSFEGDFKLSKLDYKGAEAVAYDYIAKICPEFAPSMKASGMENYILRNYNSYYVKFIRHENGIPYYNNYIVAAINAGSKKLTELEVTWDDFEKFPVGQGILPVGRAWEKFRENIGVKLCYMNDGAGNVILQYYPEKIGLGYINAFTGEISQTNISAGRFASASRDGHNLSYTVIPAEGQLPQGLIPTEKLEQNARSMLGIDEKLALVKTDPLTNGGDYYYNMLFSADGVKTINVEINAATGEITGYYKNEGQADGETVSGEFAYKSAVDFVEKIAPERLKECSQNAKALSEYKFLFPRIVNGLEYLSNGIMAEVSETSGEVISFSVSRSDGIFPDAADAVAADAAYNELFERVGFKLQYVATAKSKLTSPKSARDIEIRLVYNFVPGKPLFVSASSGGLADIRGNAYTGDLKYKYEDIGGHLQQRFVETLEACGIFEGGGYFYPDKNITQSEYLTWIYRAVKQNPPADVDDLYNGLIYGYNVLSEDERNDEAELSFEDAIKYLIKLLGYSDVAELKDTYTTGFVDEGYISPELIGYAAISKGLKIIRGNAFTPQRKVTRATAAEIIYNLLTNYTNSN